MSKVRTRRIARAVAKVVPPKSKKEGGFEAAVHVAACLQRPVKEKKDRYDDVVSSTPVLEYPGKATLEYSEYVAKLFPDQYGNLVANGSCNSGVFVCSKEELPLLIDFLQKIQAT